MKLLRMSVGGALVGALLCCGCADTSSKPTAQSSGKSTTPVVTSPSSETVSESPASTPPSSVPAAKTASTVEAQPSPPAKGDTSPASTEDPIKDMLAQIKSLQDNRPNARSREEFVAKMQEAQNAILELSQKVLDAKPEPAARDQSREAALQAITVLTQIDPKQRELLEKIDKLAEETLAESPDGSTAASVYFFRTFAHLNVERDGSENDPTINKNLFARAKEFGEKFPKDERVGMLLYQIGENAQMDSQNDTAKDILRHLVEHDPQSQYGQMASGKLKLLEAIGKPPEIAGPTLDGSEIDITQFKGKVVLVDFWATWCGPCVGELPNVKAVYDKYHEQGFEVIAVSFDQTKDALVGFVEKNKLPWPQIFFDEDGKRFWQNPLGQKYGINSIPATFLIDREGNLQKIGVRGPTLETAVAELLKAKAPTAN